MAIAFLCDFATANTSFNLSLSASAGASAGPTQTTSQSNCRPGLWRITYTSGFPSGGSSSASSSGAVLQAQTSQFIIGGGGSLGWNAQTYTIQDWQYDGTYAGTWAPATLISAGVYESFICSGAAITFDLILPYTTYPGGVSISAVGTWQAICGPVDPSLLSS